MRPHAKERSVSEPLFAPIAAIGMACWLPGGINSPRCCVRRRCAVTTRDRDPRAAVERRGVLRPGAWRAGTLSVALGRIPRHLGFRRSLPRLDDGTPAAIDPQHRLLLETVGVHRTRRDSAIVAARHKTGVYVGLYHDDHTVGTVGQRSVRIDRHRSVDGIRAGRRCTEPPRSGTDVRW